MLLEGLRHCLILCRAAQNVPRVKPTQICVGHSVAMLSPFLRMAMPRGPGLSLTRLCGSRRLPDDPSRNLMGRL